MKGLNYRLSIIHFLHITIQFSQQFLLFPIILFACFHYPCRHCYLSHYCSQILTDGIINGVYIICNYT